MHAEEQQIVLIEAESLADKGGWMVDQQFMDQMGSPYLLAHGLGVPVPDATGEIDFPVAGEYRVWVRTRDWVAPWGKPGAPGRFQILIDGTALSTTFGTEGDPWHWQDGGKVSVGEQATIAIHDLTGFEGRCDAILFCSDLDFRPPDGGEELSALRGRILGWNLEPEDGGRYDLVVVGGGVAGTTCAISAARQGLKVALIQDRPVLGGNGSSEVRVWPEGHINQQPFTHVGDIVRELVPPHPPGQAMAIEGHEYADARKEEIVRAEENITLMLNHRAMFTETTGPHIDSVIAQHTHSGRRFRVSGSFFVDSTGDGVIGAQAGADNEVMEEGNMGVTNPWSVGAVTQNEPELKCLCEDFDERMQLNFIPATQPQPFPRCPWAIDMSEMNFPGRKDFVGQWPGGSGPLANLGRWFWESGSGKHPIDDMEWIRDYNLRAMYGAWDTLKNVDGRHPNHRLKWGAYICGKRESRRLLGDVILTANDFRDGTRWPDPAFPCTWHIDVHHPDPRYENQGEVEPFIALATSGSEWNYEGPYWAPYRCLYSRNIDNLFMAGRDISVTHNGLGAVRVMRTCGMMGETVGRAAWIAVRHQTTPRGIYENYLPLLRELMEQPGLLRRDGIEGDLVMPEELSPYQKISSIPVSALEGAVVDEVEAVLNGNWNDDGTMPGHVGRGYLWSNDSAASAEYPLNVTEAGDYDLRINWLPHSNRARKMRVVVSSNGRSEELFVDQREAAGDDSFRSLGVFNLKPGEDSSIIFHVAGASGIVQIDAVQLIPVTR
ncbi:MAG: FAD-dependent oxidoreductase [Planctomycetota bacterium]